MAEPYHPSEQEKPRGNLRAWRGDRIGGAILILMGVLFLFGDALPDPGHYVVLLIGLGLMIIFMFTRIYGLLIPGSIVTGLGTGIALSLTLPLHETSRGGLVVLGLGLGFMAIWLFSNLMRLPHHHFWPLIPGGILSLIGLLLIAGPTGISILATVGPWWPVLLILAGLFLILRQSTRRNQEF